MHYMFYIIQNFDSSNCLTATNQPILTSVPSPSAPVIGTMPLVPSLKFPTSSPYFSRLPVLDPQV